MTSLAELQTAFKRSLIDDDKPIIPYIVDTTRVPREQRLAIYKNAYQSRLVEALGKDYPALNAVLGEPAFSSLCRAYIKAHPSIYFSLRWFGEKLPDFLRHSGEYPGYFHELASLEWLLMEAFDAADVPLADESHVTRIAPADWPHLRIEFHPSVHHACCHWNVHAMWRAVRDENQAPKPEQLPGPRHYITWRDHLITRYRTLELPEAGAFEAALDGAHFAHICERLTDWCKPEEVALRAASLLKSWLRDGLISQLRVER